MTQTTNIGLKKIDGSENWRQIFDYYNDSLDKTDSAVAAMQDGLAIVANGNTHSAIAKGQFVYVRNHSTLAEGLYKASSAIDTNAALSTSNLTADGSGGLNDLQEQVANNSVTGSSAITTTHNVKSARLARLGHLAVLTVTIELVSNVSAWKSIFTINNVRMDASSYVAVDVNNEIKELFVGADGSVSCTSAITSGKEIKATIPMAVM